MAGSATATSSALAGSRRLRRIAVVQRILHASSERMRAIRYPSRNSLEYLGRALRLRLLDLPLFRGPDHFRVLRFFTLVWVAGFCHIPARQQRSTIGCQESELLVPCSLNYRLGNALRIPSLGSVPLWVSRLGCCLGSAGGAGPRMSDLSCPSHSIWTPRSALSEMVCSAERCVRLPPVRYGSGLRRFALRLWVFIGCVHAHPFLCPCGTADPHASRSPENDLCSAESTREFAGSRFLQMFRLWLLALWFAV